ncbi:hypothetical protein CDD81_1054 [Ophiocordyceps australis]|uniref:DUF7728 domain-containing protein n=1 Tax=Ophiocordyceps australis TaxID=1399860 RepID=A0A2C5XZS6_9HYPO|nr:hypothetical protein CDD81_1054 [Ophiocordyceps australis]
MMLCKQVALAAAASAYLVIPPTTGVEDVFNALPIEPISAWALPAHALEQSISVPCPQCKGGDKIQLDFSIARTSRLVLNGFELYPDVDLWNDDLVASLVGADGHVEKSRLGYSLDIQEGMRDAAQDLQIVDVELRVIEVGHQYVDGLPTVHVQLIKGLKEGLSLGKVSLKEASEPDCTSMLCRAKAMLGNVMDSIKGIDWKGCGTYLLATPDNLVQDDENTQTQSEPAIPSVNSGILGQQTEESFRGTEWRPFLANLASHILMPILLGIAAGIGVAVITMTLYNIALRLMLAAKSRRSRSGRCCRKKQNSRRHQVDVEKTGLMSDHGEEQLPQYQDEVPKN